MSLQTLFEGDVFKQTKVVQVGTVNALNMNNDTMGDISNNGNLVNGVTIEDGKAFTATDDPPIIDTELANKKFVDDSVNSIEHWSRDAGTGTIFPRVPGDKVAGGLTVGGSFLIESTLNATKGPLDLVASEVKISNDLEVDIINEKTNNAGVTIESVLLENSIVTAIEINGGSLASDNLIIDSTSNATKGLINFQSTLNLVNADAPAVYAEGNVHWDGTEETMSIQLGTNNVTLRVGQDGLVRVKNTTGSTLLKAKAVYISGAQATNVLVSLAQANSCTTASVLGVVSADILNNADGFVTVRGTVININTNSFNTGDQLYLSDSVAGDLQNTVPASPNFVVRVAVVLAKSVMSGSFLVTSPIEITDTASLENLRIIGTLTVDTINEITAAAGVTAEGVLLKDTEISADNLNLPTSTASVGIIRSNGGRYIHNFGATSNFFAGVDAGNLTMTGSQNTGIGFNALAANTSGNTNVAVGNNALSLNTSGGINTAIGDLAMAANTTGAQCTAVGEFALRNNTVVSASFNTAVGRGALSQTTTGGSNTALGSQAGDLNTIGTGITCIGKDADVSGNNLTNATSLGLTAVVNASTSV